MRKVRVASFVTLVPASAPATEEYPDADVTSARRVSIFSHSASLVRAMATLTRATKSLEDVLIAEITLWEIIAKRKAFVIGAVVLRKILNYLP